MSESSIFECSLCFNFYNNSTRAPQSLPCGHVFCKSCILSYSSMYLACPVDKSPHPGVDKLPLCLNILHNLPKATSKIIYCSNHPKRQIKYRCRIHNVYICSECVIQHAGSGHDLQQFKVNTDKIKDDVKRLSESASLVMRNSERAIKEIEGVHKRASRFYENQLFKVTTAFDSAIKQLINKKAEFTETLNKMLKDQLVVIEAKRMKFNKNLEKSCAWSTKLQSLSIEMMDQTYEQFLKITSELMREISTTTPITPCELDLKFFLFNDQISLGELGSLNPLKEPLWTCSKCIFKNSEVSSVCQVCFSTKSSKSLPTNNSDSLKSLSSSNRYQNQEDFSPSQSPTHPDFARSVGPNQAHSPEKPNHKPRGKSKAADPQSHKSNVSF